MGGEGVKRSIVKTKSGGRGAGAVRVGKAQQKLLLLFFGGLALGFCRSPKVQYRILRGMIAGWREISSDTERGVMRKEGLSGKVKHAGHMRRAIDALYRSKLVRRTTSADGATTLVLTEKGRKCMLRYDLEKMRIPNQKQWNGKWHLVTYDIPEELRVMREELRRVLHRLGFVELQQSVFVHKYECRNEIEFLIEFYDARSYVRRMVVEEIDDAAPIARAFDQWERKRLSGTVLADKNIR